LPRVSTSVATLLSSMLLLVYHSASEVKGKVLRYTRTCEIKQLSFPPSKADALKRFYRVTADDERNSAVLERTTP
jgi:hypothetical protein